MSNPRTIAHLLKMETEGMFDVWESDRPLRVGAPHASAILAPESEWCLRKQVLSALYPEGAIRPPHMSWDTINNMRNKHGWAIHEKYQELILKRGNVVYFNGKPELDLSHYDETRNVWYSPDAIDTFAGQKYIWEIKGYKQETWLKLDEAGDPPTDAHRQVNLYLHLTQGIYPGALGHVLVENKNTQQTKHWIVEHDAEMAKPYTERMYSVKGHVLTKRVPERKCASPNDRQAQKCPMRELCFSGRVQEK